MSTPLTNIKGIGPNTAEDLQAHGIESAEELASAPVAAISAVPGFGTTRAQQIKQAPRMSRFLSRFTRRPAKRIKESDDFQLDTGRVNVVSDDRFAADPVNLIRLFWLADRYNVGIHPDALKLVRRSLKLINKDLRNDPEANRLFLDMLTGNRDPETILRRMNEVPEGTGTLLQHSQVFFSSEIEDGDAHRHRNLPVILAGECHGAYNTGRHIDYEPNKSVNGPPIANLFLSMMAAMGVNRASFGDNSTGLLGQLG